jgi:hypothetical protein
MDVLELHVRKATLEDVFLQLTRDRVMDDSAPMLRPDKTAIPLEGAPFPRKEPGDNGAG